MKNLPPLFQLLLFYGSRSVSFGLWAFGVATVLLFVGKIGAGIWENCFLAATILVGGRTVVAEFFGKGKTNAAPAHPPVPPQSE